MWLLPRRGVHLSDRMTEATLSRPVENEEHLNISWFVGVHRVETAHVDLHPFDNRPQRCEIRVWLDTLAGCRGPAIPARIRAMEAEQVSAFPGPEDPGYR